MYDHVMAECRHILMEHHPTCCLHTPRDDIWQSKAFRAFTHRPVFVSRETELVPEHPADVPPQDGLLVEGVVLLAREEEGLDGSEAAA